jgi:hypothetical protein
VRALVVAALLAVASPALADPPPAAVEERTVVVKRETLEVLIAEAEASLEQRQLLLKCQADVATLSKQREEEPASWWTATKWSVIGGLVVTAFAAGVWLGH